MDPLLCSTRHYGELKHFASPHFTRPQNPHLSNPHLSNPHLSMDHQMDHKMVLDGTARPTGIEAILLLNILILTCSLFPSLKLARYKTLYSSVATSIGLYSLSELWNPYYIYFGAIIHTILNHPHTMLIIFIVVFSFRYVRLVGNLVAFSLYRATAVLDHPTLTARDVTVIIPALAPYGEELKETIDCVQANEPARTIIVTAGPENQDIVYEYTCRYWNVTVTHCDRPNKRVQLCKLLPEITTAITVFCDDHVFWPPTLLSNILAPFEDPKMGSVGTSKRARRTAPLPALFAPNFWVLLRASFFNFLGCLWLERRNFEQVATIAIDGGVSTISARTAAHRTSILQDESFMYAFLHDYFHFLGHAYGPLNADDDKFVTRWMLKHNWKLVMQHCPDATVEITLGEYPKFLQQCLRWAKTTWRGNSQSLLSAYTWRSHFWCLYAVYITSLIHFPLVTELVLVYTLGCSNPFLDTYVAPKTRLVWLLVWILAGKLVKPFTHFCRYPRDLVFLPGYVAFGYFHSFIKLWALVRCWDISWGSRNLGEEKGAGEGRGEGGEVATGGAVDAGV